MHWVIPSERDGKSYTTNKLIIDSKKRRKQQQQQMFMRSSAQTKIKQIYRNHHNEWVVYLFNLFIYLYVKSIILHSIVIIYIFLCPSMCEINAFIFPFVSILFCAKRWLLNKKVNQIVHQVMKIVSKHSLVHAWGTFVRKHTSRSALTERAKWSIAINILRLPPFVKVFYPRFKENYSCRNWHSSVNTIVAKTCSTIDKGNILPPIYSSVAVLSFFNCFPFSVLQLSVSVCVCACPLCIYVPCTKHLDLCKLWNVIIFIHKEKEY